MLALPTKKLLTDVANFYNERPYIALLHKIKTVVLDLNQRLHRTFVFLYSSDALSPDMRISTWPGKLHIETYKQTDMTETC